MPILCMMSSLLRKGFVFQRYLVILNFRWFHNIGLQQQISNCKGSVDPWYFRQMWLVAKTGPDLSEVVRTIIREHIDVTVAVAVAGTDQPILHHLESC